MLILTRRVGEAVEIGGVKNGKHTLFTADGQPVIIMLRVLAMKANQARLGVDAPTDIPVHREEIADRIRIEEAGGEVNGNVGHRAHASA